MYSEQNDRTFLKYRGLELWHLHGGSLGEVKGSGLKKDIR